MDRALEDERLAAEGPAADLPDTHWCMLVPTNPNISAVDETAMVMPTNMPNVGPLWSATLAAVRAQIPDWAFEMWFRDCSVEERAPGRLVIRVPSDDVRDWLRTRYMHLLTDTISHLYGEPVELELETDARRVNASHIANRTGLTGSPLNPNFSFSTFVVGNSSRFAHGAARAVAREPARAFNPLFLYSETGLGKTHLMHAIGSYILAAARIRGTDPVPAVVYVTCEQFTHELIQAIEQARYPEFRHRYRNLDVLLIDDIQFLVGKEQTQEELFHVFNTLHDMQKQVVVSSDRPPAAISALELRLRSRFEAGLIADIQPAEFETRLAILNAKLGTHGEMVPSEVREFIAERVRSNIRDLEGALIRVLAYSMILHEPISLEMAKTTLADLDLGVTADRPTIEVVQKTVADFYGISVEDMKGRRRDRHIVFPRQVAMFLTRSQTAAALPVIGAAFGGRDQSTVVHSCEKIEELISEDSQAGTVIRSLASKIRANFRNRQLNA